MNIYNIYRIFITIVSAMVVAFSVLVFYGAMDDPTSAPLNVFLGALFLVFGWFWWKRSTNLLHLIEKNQAVSTLKYDVALQLIAILFLAIMLYGCIYRLFIEHKPVFG